VTRSPLRIPLPPDIKAKVDKIWEQIEHDNPPDLPDSTFDRLFVEELLKDDELAKWFIADIEAEINKMTAH